MPVQYIKVEDHNDAGQRIDNFLMRHLKGVPKQHVYRILRKGEVRVNSGRVKPTYRLVHGDEVRVPPIRMPESMPVQIHQADLANIEAAISYEDEDFIVVDKPAGTAVHGGSSISAGVIEMLRTSRDDHRLELAHRLDRDTSGCLLVCKNRAALTAVQEAFRSRRVSKVYTLFVAGQWPANNHTVQKRLLRFKTAWGERRVRVDSTGQTARTDFGIVGRAPHASRLEAVLHTGRTHQIRVHAKYSGFPIIGDRKYGVHEGSASRLCLHASRLGVPYKNGYLKFKAPLSPAMEEIWGRLSAGEQLD